MVELPAGAPLRVAVIGAGPAAFYGAEALLRSTVRPVQVDMFDRLPTPYGLVRHGVAPDHLKIKTVTRSFAQVAANPGFRFFGNVEFGRDITLEDIKAHYHQVLFATGAQTDRHMGIPGEDLRRSHAATEFVAWYNGHPDYRDRVFDLSQERVVIVGVGNVAIDVARILCLSPRELADSDMAEYAVEALSKSRVREVHLLGRRGPAQAAFTNPELKEIGELDDADVIVRPDEAALDPISQEQVAGSADRALVRKVEMISGYAARTHTGRRRQLFLRFLVGPTELVDDGSGAVGSVVIAHNRLERNEMGTIVARAIGQTETIAAGLVFRSVGYRGVALPGVPFNDAWGVIPNHEGRVTVDAASETPVPGLYVAGWIKRGPSGVIGTNRPDAVETAAAMLEDAAAGRTFEPASTSCESVERLLAGRSCNVVTFADWARLDELEVAAGTQSGRPRVKFTSVDAMLAALGRSSRS